MTKTQLETKRVIDRVWMQSKKIQLDVSTIQKLRRMAIKLHRQYEVYCNGPTDQHIIKAERIASDLEWKICELVTTLGLNCFFQRDPRGGTLYISKDYLNDQNYDSKGVFVA